MQKIALVSIFITLAVWISFCIRTNQEAKSSYVRMSILTKMINDVDDDNKSNLKLLLWIEKNNQLELQNGWFCGWVYTQTELKFERLPDIQDKANKFIGNGPPFY